MKWKNLCSVDPSCPCKFIGNKMWTALFNRKEKKTSAEPSLSNIHFLLFVHILLINFQRAKETIALSNGIPIVKYFLFHNLSAWNFPVNCCFCFCFLFVLSTNLTKFNHAWLCFVNVFLNAS